MERVVSSAVAVLCVHAESNIRYTHRAKLVQYLIEKAEAIFLRAKYRHKDAAEAEMHGQESEAKAAELLDVAQS